MTTTPHLSLPLEIDPATGHLREVEQDSLDDLAVAVEFIVRTVKGEREEAPNFGLEELALSRAPLDLDAIVAQIVASDPRVSVLIEEDPELFEQVVGEVSLRLTVGGSDG